MNFVSQINEGLTGCVGRRLYKGTVITVSTSVPGGSCPYLAVPVLTLKLISLVPSMPLVLFELLRLRWSPEQVSSLASESVLRLFKTCSV